MGSELKAISYISIDGAPPVRFDSLSPTKRAECISKMCDNIGKGLSAYYSQNSDAAERFIAGIKA